MNKFLVVLSDLNGVPDFLHPSEICGINKQEIKNLVMQSTPEESIAGIYTEDEYIKFINSKQFKSLNSTFVAEKSNQDGNTFMNDMIQQATSFAEQIENSNEEQVAINYNKDNEVTNDVAYYNTNNTSITQESSDTVKQIQQQTNNTKYFMDNGIQFKLENGKLFKKVWESVKIDEYINDEGQKVSPEFRIVVNNTGKPLKSDRYSVEKLVWQELNNN